MIIIFACFCSILPYTIIIEHPSWTIKGNGGGAVLAGAVLAGMVLAGAVLAGAVLAGAVLAGSVLAEGGPCQAVTTRMPRSAKAVSESGAASRSVTMTSISSTAHIVANAR